MKYAWAVLGIALAGGCGKVASSTVDAGIADAAVDGPSVDACAPTPETLDGRDNDCDGQIDEGFWATVITAPVAALTARDAACTAASIASNAYACQLAARRECQARGYAAGLRPAKLEGGNVDFTCVADVQMIAAVSYAELTRFIPGCAPKTAFDTACFAAIKRYCQSKGLKTGVGPFNVDVDASLDILCTDHGDHAGVTVDQLRGMATGCDIPAGSKPADFSCFQGYHRYCQSLGWTSGWGAVEFDGTTAYAACLGPRPKI